MRRPSSVLLRTAVIAAAVAGALVLPAIAHAAAPVAAHARTGGTPLNLRNGPSANYRSPSSVPDGSRLSLACQLPGQLVAGNVRTTDRWDKLTNGLYVSDAYVSRVGGVPACPVTPGTGGTTTPTYPTPTGLWLRPLAASVGGGFRTVGRPDHDGVDLIVGRGVAIRSVSIGTVTTAECNVPKGRSCDVDGSPSISGCGWYVEVTHPGGVVTRYCHMVRKPYLSVGAKVTAGSLLGFVGSSGNSSGPHLHFEVHVNVTSWAMHENAVDPAAFMKRVGAPLVR